MAMVSVEDEPAMRTEVRSPPVRRPEVETVTCDEAAFASMSAQPELESEELAARSQAGCLDSFEQLVTRYEAPIFHFLCQLTRSRQDAEDLTQESFIKAYRSLSRYDPALPFAPWLFTIARRAALNHLRAASHRPKPVREEEAIPQETPATLLARKEEQRSIWMLAQSLRPKQYQVLWLHYGQGFSVAETAKILQTNSLHVKVLLYRARNHLSKILADRGWKSSFRAAEGPEPELVSRAGKDFP